MRFLDAIGLRQVAPIKTHNSGFEPSDNGFSKTFEAVGCKYAKVGHTHRLRELPVPP